MESMQGRTKEETLPGIPQQTARFGVKTDVGGEFL
ncbi:MAG: hypothetical protein QOI31_1797 [Solirubrobacterales bacterium]|jgi:hypothetical protein|nr:hypothetical protein [Solirubrobacterales bacterium]